MLKNIWMFVVSSNSVASSPSNSFHWIFLSWKPGKSFFDPSNISKRCYGKQQSFLFSLFIHCRLVSVFVCVYKCENFLVFLWSFENENEKWNEIIHMQQLYNSLLHLWMGIGKQNKKRESEWMMNFSRFHGQSKFV